MSVATMTTMAARTGNENDKAALDTQLGKTAAYIPSEVLGIYVAVLGLVTPGAQEWGLKRTMYVGTLLVLLLFISLRYLVERKSIREANNSAAAIGGRSVPEPKMRYQVAAAVMAIVAFTAYYMALPGSFFEKYWSNSTIYGAIAAILLALFLPMIGVLVGVSPEAKKK